jgi:hypothetical protein
MKVGTARPSAIRIAGPKVLKILTIRTGIACARWYAIAIDSA